MKTKKIFLIIFSFLFFGTTIKNNAGHSNVQPLFWMQVQENNQIHNLSDLLNIIDHLNNSGSLLPLTTMSTDSLILALPDLLRNISFLQFCDQKNSIMVEKMLEDEETGDENLSLLKTTKNHSFALKIRRIRAHNI